jgi:hypothetical protein
MRALILLALAGCVSTPCFTPPPTSTQEQHEILLKAAAAIAVLPVTPSLEVDFKNAINTTYVSLNDDNQTYFMAASLALCFAKEGKWGQEVAARILIDLETQWKARTGASSVDQHPQADQVRAIQKAVSSDK